MAALFSWYPGSVDSLDCCPQSADILDTVVGNGSLIQLVSGVHTSVGNGGLIQLVSQVQLWETAASFAGIRGSDVGNGGLIQLVSWVQMWETAASFS